MRRLAAESPEERFHSPCEGFDTWPGNELVMSSTDCFTAVSPCPVPSACVPTQPGASLKPQGEQQIGHQEVNQLLGPMGFRLRSTLHVQSPLSLSTSTTPSCVTGNAASAPVPAPAVRRQRQLAQSFPRLPMPKEALGDHEKHQQSARSDMRAKDETCCASPQKSRSISQPRSVRDLVPRQAPLRRLASVPYGLGMRSRLSCVGVGGKSALQVKNVEAAEPKGTATANEEAVAESNKTLPTPPQPGQNKNTGENPPKSAGFSRQRPSRMLMWLLAVGGAFCITLSCVAAVASLIAASRLSEAPVLFLERKSHVMQSWPVDGSQQTPQSSSVWLEEAESNTSSPLHENEKTDSSRTIPSQTVVEASVAQSSATQATLILADSAPKRIAIGDLRSTPLEEVAVSLGLLLQTRPDEEHFFRVEDAARNRQTRETLLSLSRGHALVLKRDLGLLLSPQSAVMAAWRLPDAHSHGPSVFLSPEQLQAQLQAAALHASGESTHTGDTGKKASVVGQSLSSSNPQETLKRPPESELDFQVIDAGEPLLVGFLEGPQQATGGGPLRKVERADEETAE